MTEPCPSPRRGVTLPLSVAPMMQRTDRHFRWLMRRITRRTLLYTEMVNTGAILYGDRERHLGFSPDEHPVALQLGGDDPAALAECAAVAEAWGYDEVDLNVGCPSDRVQNGAFGASLMARPERVAEAIAAMRAATTIPVTVKHRIGIDDLDRYEDMLRFVDIVAAAGADRFSVHARKAWLKGLSPKENRNIPPLRYEDVYRLKAERPELSVVINGGVTTLDASAAHLERVDGVMIGRAAWDRPWLFSDVDSRFFGSPDPGLTRVEVVEAAVPYAEAWIARGGRLHQVSRHVLNLFHGCPGARAFRRHISEHACLPDAGAEVLSEALTRLPGYSPAGTSDQSSASSSARSSNGGT